MNDYLNSLNYIEKYIKTDVNKQKLDWTTYGKIFKQLKNIDNLKNFDWDVQIKESEVVKRRKYSNDTIDFFKVLLEDGRKYLYNRNNNTYQEHINVIFNKFFEMGLGKNINKANPFSYNTYVEQIDYMSLKNLKLFLENGLNLSLLQPYNISVYLRDQVVSEQDKVANMRRHRFDAGAIDEAAYLENIEKIKLVLKKVRNSMGEEYFLSFAYNLCTNILKDGYFQQAKACIEELNLDLNKSFRYLSYKKICLKEIPAQMEEEQMVKCLQFFIQEKYYDKKDLEQITKKIIVKNPSIKDENILKISIMATPNKEKELKIL